MEYLAYLHVSAAVKIKSTLVQFLRKNVKLENFKRIKMIVSTDQQAFSVTIMVKVMITRTSS